VRAALLAVALSVAAPSAQAPAPVTSRQPAAPAAATVKPESVGLSSERLARIDRTMRQYVDEHRLAGVVTLVARRGKVVQFESFGKLDVERGAPMTMDAIFRIASMSKAVTTVAVLMLMEEGKLVLTDPVSKFIPRPARPRARPTASFPPAARSRSATC
jgi:CubicO group peptidase (beta-lactamase class C family)